MYAGEAEQMTAVLRLSQLPLCIPTQLPQADGTGRARTCHVLTQPYNSVTPTPQYHYTGISLHQASTRYSHPDGGYNAQTKLIHRCALTTRVT